MQGWGRLCRGWVVHTGVGGVGHAGVGWGGSCSGGVGHPGVGVGHAGVG